MDLHIICCLHHGDDSGESSSLPHCDGVEVGGSGVGDHRVVGYVGEGVEGDKAGGGALWISQGGGRGGGGCRIDGGVESREAEVGGVEGVCEG